MEKGRSSPKQPPPPRGASPLASLLLPGSHPLGEQLDGRLSEFHATRFMALIFIIISFVVRHDTSVIEFALGASNRRSRLFPKCALPLVDKEVEAEARLCPQL